MTELEIMQKQIESLKELIEIQNKVIEVLKTQPQQLQIQYVPNQPNYQQYYYPYQNPYYQYPYYYGIQSCGLSTYGQQQNALNNQQNQMYANQVSNILSLAK